jgi:glycosyltransferase involved in cell wall biosynthesis
MKVLQINSVCGIRSTGRICTDIADILQKGGDDCKIAYGRENVPTQYVQSSIRIGCDIDVKCHALMTRIFDNTGQGSKKATKDFLKWVDEYDPDVIHLHNLHGYYINLELLFNYLKKSGKPVIWTLHDCWAFTGHCSHFDYIGCRKWEIEGCHTCPQKRKYPTSMVMDRSKKNFFEKKELFTGLDHMTIVTPSQWLADLVKCSFLKEYSINVIHNGIDLSAFSPVDGNFRERYGLQGKTIYLGVATAWGQAKGLYDFYKINEIKAENEVIVLVGLTAKQLDDLPDGIIGIERTNSIEELAEIYSAADVFINPTYEEVFGLTNVEAQACATPVVTYRSGGSTESVPSDHVVERGDTMAILQKAREVAKFQTLFDVTVFSRDSCYLKYQNLYHQIFSKYKN